MLFKPESIEKIKSGHKTQTRRIVKPGEIATNSLYTGGIDAVYSAGGRIKWTVGRTYAICPGRNKPEVGRVLLRVIRQERLHDIDAAGIIAEGFGCDRCKLYHKSCQCRGNFAFAWDAINKHVPGGRWQDDPLVWVLEFEDVSLSAPTTCDLCDGEGEITEWGTGSFSYSAETTMTCPRCKGLGFVDEDSEEE